MMSYDHDVLMPYENALLKFNSRKKSKNTRYNIKKISSVLGREFQIEIAKGFAREKQWKVLCNQMCVFFCVIVYLKCVPRSYIYRTLIPFEKTMLRVITLNIFFKNIHW